MRGRHEVSREGTRLKIPRYGELGCPIVEFVSALSLSTASPRRSMELLNSEFSEITLGRESSMMSVDNLGLPVGYASSIIVF